MVPVEMWLGVLLGDLLGAESRYGLAMYYAIVSTSARMDTIAAAATERIGSSSLIEFEKLLRTIRSRARERNTIVHSNWGISLKHPKAIVSVQTESHVRFWHLPEMRRESRDDALTSDEWERFIWRELKPMTYRMSDFEATKARLRSLITEIKQFRNSVPRA
jgi:broad specificity phosphatase PhoE